MRLILGHHGLIPLGAECKDARVQCFRHTLKNHTWSTLIWSTPPQQSLLIPVLLWDIKLHKSNGHVTNSGITFWNFGAICTPLLLSLLKIVRSLCIQFCKCQHTFFFFLHSCLRYANDFGCSERNGLYSLYSIVSYVCCLCTDVTCCKGRLLSRISFNVEVLYICVCHIHACMFDLIFKCKENGLAAAIALFKRKELVYFFYY